MAFLVRSQQVVKWGEKIIMKGFHRLLVATMAASGLVVWHLFCNESAKDRISYTDSRLEGLKCQDTSEISLRCLEDKRHVVGWCADAIELCGGSFLFYLI
jgi:hypothetical protein